MPPHGFDPLVLRDHPERSDPHQGERSHKREDDRHSSDEAARSGRWTLAERALRRICTHRCPPSVVAPEGAVGRKMSEAA